MLIIDSDEKRTALLQMIDASHVPGSAVEFIAEIKSDLKNAVILKDGEEAHIVKAEGKKNDDIG